MSQAYSANGTRIYIGAAVTEEPADAAAYALIAWTEVQGVESIGDLGDETEILTATTLLDGRVFKGKGPRDAGTLPLVCLDRPDDAGQIALVAAEGTNFNYPFRVVLPNRITVGGQDQTEYFIGLVSSKRLNVGDVSNIVRRRFDVAINSKITTVPAS